MRTGELSELGELQWAVLFALWKLGGGTVHEVRAALPSERSLAYTTILTVLRNLEKRELITHDALDGSRMFRYRPLLSPQEAREEMVTQLIARQFENSPAALLRHLLADAPLAPSELKELRQIIAARLRA